MASPTLASVGLVLDILGVVLLYRYGLPSPVGPPDAPPTVAWDGPSPEERAVAEKEWNRYQRGSRLGLGLLIAGFTLQILGNHR